MEEGFSGGVQGARVDESGRAGGREHDYNNRGNMIITIEGT